MGFFKKVFKGIGKVFRKIGRGIKKVAGKVGKFFGKFGIIGQIGLGLLLPGVGSMLSGMLGSVGGALAGSSNILLQGAGKFIQGAIEIGGRVGNAFSTVTEGVTKVIGETVGAVANNLGLSDPILNVTKSLGINGGQGIDISSKTFGSVWKTTQDAMENAISAGKDIFAPLPSAAPTTLSPPEIEKARILEAEKAGVELPEWDKVVDISEVANENTLGYTPVETTSPSLLDRGITAIKEAPARFGEAAISTVENYPKEIASKIKSGVTTQAMQKLGLEDEPVYNITNVAGYVPTIDLEGTSDIGIASAQFNPVDYMTNNSEAMSLKPFGFNANIYNYANQYKGAMSQYGYAV